MNASTETSATNSVVVTIDSKSDNQGNKPSTSTSKNKVKVFFEGQKTQVSTVKHGVLSRYLKAWLPILSQNQWRTRKPYSVENPQYKRIVYVDGFAGPGKYSGGDCGSPVLAYELALTHERLDSNGPEIVFIFIEKETKYCAELIKNLKSLRSQHEHTANVNLIKYMVICGEFVAGMIWIVSPGFELPVESTEDFSHVPSGIETELLVSDPGQTGRPDPFITKTTPLLVFADPFGYNGEHMPMTLMRHIFDRSEKSELLINLMTGFVRRFFTLDSRTRPINLLMGNSEDDASWKPVILEEEDSKEKLKIFLQFYEDRLSESRSEKYTCLFEVKDKGNRLLYHLFFISPHNRGFQTMKSAMSRESQDAGFFTFSVFDLENQIPRKEISIDDLVESIENKFKCNRFVTGVEITAYIESFKTLVQRYKVPLKNKLAFKYCVNLTSAPLSAQQFDLMLLDFEKETISDNKMESPATKMESPAKKMESPDKKIETPDKKINKKKESSSSKNRENTLDPNQSSIESFLTPKKETPSKEKETPNIEKETPDKQTPNKKSTSSSKKRKNTPDPKQPSMEKFVRKL